MSQRLVLGSKKLSIEGLSRGHAFIPRWKCTSSTASASFSMLQLLLNSFDVFLRSVRVEAHKSLEGFVQVLPPPSCSVGRFTAVMVARVSQVGIRSMLSPDSIMRHITASSQVSEATRDWSLAPRRSLSLNSSRRSRRKTVHTPGLRALS